MKTYRVIGLMSGSSLDGLDLADCRFWWDDGWKYRIHEARCLPYSEIWITTLRQARQLTAVQLQQLDHEFGKYIGECSLSFINSIDDATPIDAICSHGHTVYHFPEKGFTWQIGHGATLAASCRLPVITDLRSTDIACGGQGTPIVPIADWHLFPTFPVLLNIGGIANISVKTRDQIFAFDCCAANQLLNAFAGEAGLSFDKNGQIARQGNLIPACLEALNSSPFFHRPFPKSLDNGFSQEQIALMNPSWSVPDKLASACEHIAQQIAASLAMAVNQTGNTHLSEKQLLVTGGGAFNRYLIERLDAHVPLEIVVPDVTTVMYKEALAMAFIGVLRLRGEANVLCSVTGARHDTVGGALFLP
ncbi:MAG: anhydro-N-acetylmuramic acid kinase [Chitinophagales bacterium]